ncbi:ParB/RepB/Spo0J family partition protein [Streptomyces sp. NPDC058308]|uniref:ParB/RepB/Spo0J family partition protein n=1 Tax=Streptomyces sp. NPDC058308 TaxID=3346440 RepID=UPI0036E9EB17
MSTEYAFDRAYGLSRVKLDQVAATPLNPRREFGTDEELVRFGEGLRAKQLVPCVAVTRQAYLGLWPDHAEQLGESAQYVLVSGERRLRGARRVEMDELDLIVRDDLAVSRETFVDHQLQENLDRKDFDLVERARGIEALVTVCAEAAGRRGAQVRAARRLRRDRSWVTNQLVLLALPDELQRRLSDGTLSERDGRVMARHAREHSGLSVDELLSHLTATRRAERAKRATGTRPATASESARSGASDDPMAQLDVFRRKAVQFGSDMLGLEEVYRAAAKTDAAGAAKHLSVIKERVDRVVRHLAETPSGTHL